MDKIRYRLVFNRKNKLNNQGTALIQVEASLNHRRAYFRTNIYIKPTQWNKSISQIINHPQSNELNAMLYEIILAYQQLEINLWKRDIQPTLTLLRDTKSVVHATDFLSFAQGTVANSDRRKNTKNNLITTINLVKRFKTAINITDITYNFLREFENFMKEDGQQINTIAKHLKNIRTMVNEAIKCGLMHVDDYPFRSFKIKTIKKKKPFLTDKEVTRIEKLKLTGRIAKVRDAFIFCCFTGLRYSDFRQLTNASITNEWLSIQMIKTNMSVQIPISRLFDGKAKMLLSRYNIANFQRIGCNADANKALKIIVQQAKIEKCTTWHTARHTFATLLLQQGLAITTVQKLLGHTDVKTTQVYTEVTKEGVIMDLNRVLKRSTKNRHGSSLVDS